VIDKDYASSLIAKEAGVDLFIILTGVDRVIENFGTEKEIPIKKMSVAKARKMLADGQFPPGSMGPKITAAIDYIEGGGKEVLITSAEKLRLALIGRSGTKIVRDSDQREGE
jgi:carbamate kinase